MPAGKVFVLGDNRAGCGGFVAVGPIDQVNVDCRLPATF
jgi:hypothetical protein